MGVELDPRTWRSHLPQEAEAFKTLTASCFSSKPSENWTVAEFDGQVGAGDHLKLITFHSSKGLEFDAVYMMGMDQGIIPWNNATEQSKQESRRLFYVGRTRAKHEIAILFSGWIQTKFGKKSFAPASEFVIDIKKRLREEDSSQQQ